VRARVSFSLSRAITTVLARIKRVFDLACDPSQITETLSDLKGITGLRVPGAFDGFELSVRAILGQQVSVKAAQTLAGRLASSFGKPTETPHPSIQYLFPRASAIARCSVNDLRNIGITKSRSHSLIALAKAVDSRRIELTPNADVFATMTALTELPGIGQWTAQYIAMRALSWPDAFPHTDLGIRKALGGVTPGQILKIADQWKPWRSYAAMSLWQALNERD
jgi:AraC family transcriptional regulator of adaptative response / DNA-3-methyladenine glycosylase II